MSFEYTVVDNDKYFGNYTPGTVLWIDPVFQRVVFHREDKPVIQRPDGTEFWYLNSRTHREGGPAVTYSDGSKEWYFNGKLHRMDGPALVLSTRVQFHYVNGVWCPNREIYEAAGGARWKQCKKLDAEISYLMSRGFEVEAPGFLVKDNLTFACSGWQASWYVTYFEFGEGFGSTPVKAFKDFRAKLRSLKRDALDKVQVLKAEIQEIEEVNSACKAIFKSPRV